MARQDGRLMDGTFSEGLETLTKLARHGGFTTRLAAAIRQEGGVDKAIDALLTAFGQTGANPFELSVEEQLHRFKEASDSEGWGFDERIFTPLSYTASPRWPSGRLALRSLRIRFGHADAGVAHTCEAHAKRIKSVFGSAGYERWSDFKSGPQSLRLLNGNETHRPVVEWVYIDLDTHRRRESIGAVRSADSLADELLVVAWMFPELIRAIDSDTVPGLLAAGYQATVPEGAPWEDVPIVTYNRGGRRAKLGSYWQGTATCGDAVPTLRK